MVLTLIIKYFIYKLLINYNFKSYKCSHLRTQKNLISQFYAIVRGNSLQKNFIAVHSI